MSALIPATPMTDTASPKLPSRLTARRRSVPALLEGDWEQGTRVNERRRSGPLVHYSDAKTPNVTKRSPKDKREDSKRELKLDEKDKDKPPSRANSEVIPSSTASPSEKESSGIDKSTSVCQVSQEPDPIPSIMPDSLLGDREREVYDIRGLMFLLCVTVLLGSIIGVVGGIFHKVVYFVRDKLRAGLGGVLYEESPILMYCSMAFICVFTAVTVGIITQKMCPECIGGGMIATRICVSLGAPLRFEVVLYRFVLSSLYMGGGNPLGAEAPTLHICAALAGSINGFFSRIFPSLLNLETMPQIVLIGCVAGLSQAFHTPLGALLFALEEFDFVRRSHITFVLISACAVPAVLVSSGLKNELSSGGNAALFSIPPPRNLDKIHTSLSTGFFGGVTIFFLATFIGIVMAFLAELFGTLTAL